MTREEYDDIHESLDNNKVTGRSSRVYYNFSRITTRLFKHFK